MVVALRDLVLETVVGGYMEEIKDTTEKYHWLEWTFKEVRGWVSDLGRGALSWEGECKGRTGGISRRAELMGELKSQASFLSNTAGKMACWKRGGENERKIKPKLTTVRM